MTNELLNDTPKVQLAGLESELEALKLKKETLKEKIKMIPVRNAQILFYAGLAVCATVYGTIFGVGPIMVIAGIIYWVNSNKKRAALQQELADMDETISKTNTEVNIKRASLTT